MPVNVKCNDLELPFQKELCMRLTIGCDLWGGADHETQHQDESLQENDASALQKTGGPPRVSGLIQRSFNPLKFSFLLAMTENF